MFIILLVIGVLVLMNCMSLGYYGGGDTDMPIYHQTPITFKYKQNCKRWRTVLDFLCTYKKLLKKINLLSTLKLKTW